MSNKQFSIDGEDEFSTQKGFFRRLGQIKTPHSFSKFDSPQ